MSWPTHRHARVKTVLGVWMVWTTPTCNRLSQWVDSPHKRYKVERRYHSSTLPVPDLALMAFSGRNHLFAADYSIVKKNQTNKTNLAPLFLLEIKPHAWFFRLFPVGYVVRTVLRNLPLLEDSNQLYCWVWNRNRYNFGWIGSFLYTNFLNRINLTWFIARQLFSFSSFENFHNKQQFWYWTGNTQLQDRNTEFIRKSLLSGKSFNISVQISQRCAVQED